MIEEGKVHRFHFIDLSSFLLQPVKFHVVRTSGKAGT